MRIVILCEGKKLLDYHNNSKQNHARAYVYLQGILFAAKNKTRISAGLKFISLIIFL